MVAAKMAMPRAARPYDVIVYGASGFTGRLVAEHLARDYGGRVRWAMAGRSESKLREVRQSLSKINPQCAGTPLLIADAFDRDAMGDVLRQGAAVVSTAGPYARYGDVLVEQAVEQGTHYCDLTAELPWVRRNMRDYGELAAAGGTKIVHCCGFDSVPSDLGTLLVVDYMKNTLGKKTAKVYNLIGQTFGGFSGGTIESGRSMMEGDMSEFMACSANAYYLADAVKGSRKGTDQPSPVVPSLLSDVDGGTWAGPFVMEVCNGRVVHWSNALAAEAYGSDFKYLEAVEAGKGPLGFVAANALAATLGVMALLVSPSGKLVQGLLPSPGEGPGEEMRTGGFWNSHVTAISEEAPGVKPTVVKAHIGDPKRDPGYWSTSRMLLEAGLCLALQQKQLKESGCKEGGVMSPAAALGLTYVERLRQAGYIWEVTEVDGKPVPKPVAAATPSGLGAKA